MKVNRPQTECIAVDLGIAFRDVAVDNDILTVYITSPECQSIVDGKSLNMYIALALDIPAENVLSV